MSSYRWGRWAVPSHRSSIGSAVSTLAQAKKCVASLESECLSKCSSALRSSSASSRWYGESSWSEAQRRRSSSPSQTTRVPSEGVRPSTTVGAALRRLSFHVGATSSGGSASAGASGTRSGSSRSAVIASRVRSSASGSAAFSAGEDLTMPASRACVSRSASSTRAATVRSVRFGNRSAVSSSAVSAPGRSSPSTRQAVASSEGSRPIAVSRAARAGLDSSAKRQSSRFARSGRAAVPSPPISGARLRASTSAMRSLGFRSRYPGSAAKDHRIQSSPWRLVKYPEIASTACSTQAASVGISSAAPTHRSESVRWASTAATASRYSGSEASVRSERMRCTELWASFHAWAWSPPLLEEMGQER